MITIFYLLIIMKQAMSLLTLIITLPFVLIGVVLLLVLLGLELPFYNDQDFDDFIESHPETQSGDYSDFDF